MSAGAKITQEELIAMFGSKMPAVAVNLLWEAPEGWSIGKVREELRKIAADQSRATESLGVSQGEQTASLPSKPPKPGSRCLRASFSGSPSSPTSGLRIAGQ